MISGPVKGSYYYLGHLRLDLLARSSFSLRRQKLLPRGKEHSLPKICSSTIGCNLYSSDFAVVLTVGMAVQLSDFFFLNIEMFDLLLCTN